MIGKPILFTQKNRAASVAGTKTQTRRVINLPDGEWIYSDINDKGDHLFVKADWQERSGSITDHTIIIKARYSVGEIVWMQEPYQIQRGHPGDSTDAFRRGLIGLYLDDGTAFEKEITSAEWNKWVFRKYPSRNTSARFMYKSLTRHFFEITGIRVERVQDISEADAKAEGCQPEDVRCRGLMNSGAWQTFSLYKAGFKSLWNSINEKRGFGWDTNCWVWVYEY